MGRTRSGVQFSPLSNDPSGEDISFIQTEWDSTNAFGVAATQEEGFGDGGELDPHVRIAECAPTPIPDEELYLAISDSCVRVNHSPVRGHEQSVNLAVSEHWI
ncbi:hypothetical protein H1R20_g1993, partial [Candolleomyces eurysporus]